VVEDRYSQIFKLSWVRPALVADGLAERLGTDLSRPEIASAEPAPEPFTAEVRTWARTTGLDVPDRGRLHPDIWQAWRAAHGQ